MRDDSEARPSEPSEAPGLPGASGLSDPASAADIAIVGVGCRLPGEVRDLTGLWQVLMDGTDVTTAVPPDRWGPEFHHPDPRNPGTTYCPKGAFLDDIARFDAAFFGIAPREAREIDPQQRLLLQTAWAAMENSGIPRSRWEGSRTGVFTGILGMDYALLHAKTSGIENIDPYYASGKEFSFGAGRIAYTFGLHGPCLMLSTACSSSLTAVHLASQSLRSGECDAALAGGVNLMLVPELTVFMSKIEALSPRGLCRPFDASADGVVRGEGCVVVVLKRYADAVADGDRIWAVVKGSAVNHDGRSAGLTAPNSVAQAALLRTALANAGVAAHDIDYVEAHCTGTPLGDPLEIAALSEVIGAGRDPARPLLVGSHKANFGHLDSAAGLLGLLKAVLVARHGVVPPQIGVELPNPAVDWARSGLRVATEATALPGDGPRLVGVSAFGLSGSNAHIVLAAPPDQAPPPAPASSAPPVLVLSAPGSRSLAEQAAAHRDLLRSASPEDLPDLLHSAAARRTHHDFRLAVVADHPVAGTASGTAADALSDCLTAYLAGEHRPEAAAGDVLAGGPPPIVHVFSGQGSQWPGMGLDLYRAQPLVRRTLDECDALIREFDGWSVLAELSRTERSRLPQTRFAQPAVFAVQLALTRLWTAWGLAPAAVVGHSMGEVAAACAAGAITVRDAVRLIVHRGRIMQDATGSGQMAAVDLPAEEVRAALAPLGDEVCIATVNGPRSVVIAGPAEPLGDAVAALRKAGATCQPLGVDYAFHSPAVHRHGDELEATLGPLSVAEPSVTLMSSVDPGTDNPVTDASYWARNVREPVMFWPAIDRRLAHGDALFIEIGAHPVLSRPLRAALAHRGRTGPVVSSLSRGKPGLTTLAGALATLHTVGAPVDWAAVHGPGHRYLELPALHLTGKQYWLSGVQPGTQRGSQDGAATVPAPADPGDLRAEVRLFDRAGRLVATLDQTAQGAVAGGTAAVAPGPVPPAAPPAGAAVVPAPVPAPVPVPVPVAAPARAGGPGREQIAQAVSAAAGEILGLDASDRISRVRGFYELGFDSFSIVELTKRLRAQFGVELSGTAGINHPTIDRMTDHVAAEIAANPATTGAAVEPAVVGTDPAVVGTALAGTATGTAVTGLSPAGPAPIRNATAAPATTAPVPAGPAPAGTWFTEPPGPARAPAGPAAVPAGAAEPVAIVGMSCRLPGAENLDAYWQLLCEAVDATSDVPADRWDAAGMVADGPVEPGTVVTRRGAFLDGLDRFDNAFFRVSAREARSMDPQQRIFLEVAWEALEDAGLSPEALRAGSTGLYVGLNTTDYQQLVTRHAENVDLYYGTGNSFSGTAGRLSYFLGVRGPSLAVDTACSSSLVAVHLACQSLRSGEADVAVAGGSNAIVTPTVYLAMSAGGALSPDGRCKTFADGADGYGRGEGAGAVVLKTLSRALADGDRVHAVIRGSAVNHNGASGGLTVPSADAQAEVIAAALAQAGLSAGAVDYVEAHGTGTTLGDAVELTALDRALGPDRPRDRPLLVGSVKTNIGHLEAAAGVAGLIKTVLALRHGSIPAHLHFDRPSGQVEWDRLRLRVVARRTPWPGPPPGRGRTAGVSAFGFTGTNAHVVLDAAPVVRPGGTAAQVPVTATRPAGHPGTSAEADHPLPARPMALSVTAASQAALYQAAGRMARHLDTVGDEDVADVCHSAGARRAQLAYRMVVVGGNRAELRARLGQLPDPAPAAPDGTAGRSAVPAPGVRLGTARTGEPTRYALVFGKSVADLPWRGLDGAEPAFRAALDAVEAEGLALFGRSVRAALLPGAAVEPVEVLAAQIGLTALWRDHGLRPDAIAGQGIGEIAAAHAAGVLSLRDALLAAGGVRSVRLSGQAAVPLHLESLTGTAADLARWVPPGAIAPLAADRPLAGALTAEGVEVVLDAGLGPAGPALADAAPGGALSAVGRHTGPDSQAPVTAVTQSPAGAARTGPAPAGDPAAAHLHITAPSSQALVTAIAELHVIGARVDWAALLGGHGQVVSLPGYPWQHRRHWVDVPVLAPAGGGGGAHPWLGTAVAPFDAPQSRYFPVRLGGSTADGLAGAATVVELALAAAGDLLGGGPLRLHTVVLEAPLTDAADLAPGAGAQLAARREGAGWSLRLIAGGTACREPVQVAVARADRMALPPTGSAPEPEGREPAAVTAGTDRPSAHRAEPLAAPPAPGGRPTRPPALDLPGLRARLGTAVPAPPGYAGGPAFTELCQDQEGRERLAAVRVFAQSPSDGPGLPPGLATAAIGLLLSSAGPDGAEAAAVTGVEEVRLYAPVGEDVLVHAVSGSGAVRLLDTEGRVLAEFLGVRTTGAAALRTGDDVRDRLAKRLYAIRWQEAPEPPQSAEPHGQWVVVPGSAEAVATAGGIAAALRRAGAPAEVSPPQADGEWAGLFGGVAAARGVVLVTAAVPGRQRPPQAVLAGARALAATAGGPGGPPRLWIVTAGAQAPDRTGLPDAGQAAAWAVGRVVAMEAPDSWGGLVDLEPGAGDGRFDAAAGRLLGAPAEDEVCLRDGLAYVPRLVPADPPPRALRPLRCRPDAWYAVTGGPAAASGVFLDWLIGHGVRRLLLVQTGEGTAHDADTVRAALPGTEVAVVRLGPDRPGSELDEVLRGAPLGGVLVAPQQTPARPLDRTEPRHLAVDPAAARLGQAVLGRPLDFFWIFGSAAAEWGSVGMAAGAAAEGESAALAAELAAAGTPVTVVRWMPRADTGELDRRDRMLMEDSGLEPLEGADVAEAMDVLLRSGYREVSVARVDERRYAQTCRSRLDRAFLSVLDRGEAGPDGDAAASRTPFVAGLLALAPDLRADQMLDFVLTRVAEVLDAGGGGVDPDQGFFELGMDSVMSLSLKTRLDRGLGGDLPATLTFEYPTSRALAGHLLAEVQGPDADAGGPARPPERDAAPDGLDELSDDELMERLLSRLAGSAELLSESEGD